LTTAYSLKCGELSPEMTHDLARLERLHHSDWYFNRALFRILLGVEYLHKGIGVRDDVYYASATLKAITKCRKIVSKENVPTLECRELAPEKPSIDQTLLLSVRNALSVDEILSIMKKLLPIYTSL